MSEEDSKELRRTLVSEDEWQQPRVGQIFEVEMEDHRLKYNIQVTDVGRNTPFIDQYFSSEEAAGSLLDKVKKQSGGMEQDERFTEADVATPKKPRTRPKLEATK